MFIRLTLILFLFVPNLYAEDPSTFGKADFDKLPKGWKIAKTGSGTTPIWKVMREKDNPSKTGYVLAQHSISLTEMFNLCILEGTSAQGVEISVKMKSLRGQTDQGGGVVWRYKDENNYYVTRYNPLEKNFRLYKVVDGKRTQLASNEDLTLEKSDWHSIRVRHVGKRIVCKLDDDNSLQIEDETFPNAGKVGLWTKADAQTAFDQFIVINKGNQRE
jgi:hypothetical protein